MTLHVKTSDFSLEQPDGSCYILLVLDVHMHASEKVMAPHSSTLAWKIPWMEEPCKLQSMGSQRVGHD